LGLHCYEISTHPAELVLEPPPKIILDPPMIIIELCGATNIQSNQACILQYYKS